MAHAANQCVPACVVVNWCRFHVANSVALVLIGLWVHYWTDGAFQVEDLERRLKTAEGHIEAGRLLAFYQVGILTSIPNQICVTNVCITIAW